MNNKDEELSCQIREVFQASYRIEAELLGVIDFPPLKRKMIDFINSDTEFYGSWIDGKIVAIVEVKPSDKHTDIHSLVVHPEHFRQGHGKRLIQFVLKTLDSEVYTVETGLKNEPAIKLYTELGFVEQEQWDTDFGVRKVKFIKKYRIE